MSKVKVLWKLLKEKSDSVQADCGIDDDGGNGNGVYHVHSDDDNADEQYEETVEAAQGEEPWAMSTFSPIGSRSSDGVRMYMCVWNKLEVCATLAFIRIWVHSLLCPCIHKTHTHMHPQTIWGQWTDGAKSGYCLAWWCGSWSRCWWWRGWW